MALYWSNFSLVVLIYCFLLHSVGLNMRVYQFNNGYLKLGNLGSRKLFIRFSKLVTFVMGIEVYFLWSQGFSNKGLGVQVSSLKVYSASSILNLLSYFWPSVIYLQPECQDDYHTCHIWAAKGECTTYEVWMKRHCKKSCKVCQGK